MSTIAHKLLISCIERKDFRTISSAKGEWFDAKEKIAFDFVKEYYKEHAELPPIDVYTDRFPVKSISTGRPGYFLRELKNRYIATSLTSAIPRIMASLGTDPSKGLDDLQNAIRHLRSDTYTSKDITYADASSSRFEAYLERVRTKGVVHLSTGIEVFDTTFYGYRKADLITIGGRAGMGKSWLVLFLAIQLEMLLRDLGIDKPILFITNEMPEDEIIERVDCLKFKLPYEDFMKGSLLRADKKRYREGLKQLEKEGSALKIAYNCSTIDELNVLIDMYDPAMVFIDGSYMMEQDQGEGWEKITYVTRNLKRTAKSKSTPIINTTQLKRSTGKGSSKMSIDGQDDFAYSQSYAQDSDIAFRMFQTADMIFNAQIGLEVVKGRRVKPNTRYIFTNNLASMVQDVVLEEEATKTAVIW